MRALLFDPFAGISGDMTLGALLDLGLPATWLTGFATGLGLGGIGVRTERVMRSGIACMRVQFELPHDHAHRHLRDVVDIIERSRAPVRAKERAIEAFRRIASAEAEVHGTTLDRVHFHEVGALDAILDILGSMSALEELGFEAFFTRPVSVGSGSVEISHGRFPVPAPATLRILEGIPLGGFELEGECTTPTGAAILATLSRGAPPPAIAVALRSGFGAGTRDPEARPNCLRLVALEVTADLHAEPLHLVQCDVDDLAPEYAAAAQDALIAAGALDAVLLQVAMKKGRPGLRIEALCPGARLQDVIDAMLRSTSTIGVRHWPVSRPALPRSEETLEFRGQTIRVKRVMLPGGAERTKPEYEDVVRAAAALGIPPFELRRALEARPSLET